MLLVTGGTGFVGRRLVTRLCNRGDRVRVLTRSPERARALWGNAVQIARGDVLEAASVDAALRGVTAVVHLAAVVAGPGVVGGRLRETNVQGAANIAAAAARWRVARFVHGSSGGVYGDGASEAPHREDSPLRARTAYERSKLDAERSIRATLAGSDVALTVLRIAGLHGPGRPATVQFQRAVSRKHVWVHGPSRVIVHPTHVDDVVQAIERALDRDAASDTFNIAGERIITYPALIELTARLLGTRTRQVSAPSWSATLAHGVLRTAHLLTGRLGDAAMRVSTPLINRSLDTTRARQVLGFEPVPLETAISDSIAWHRREGLL
jgi:nucleoside-diphosphate-sugar epimerase